MTRLGGDFGPIGQLTRVVGATFFAQTRVVIREMTLHVWPKLGYLTKWSTFWATFAKIGRHFYSNHPVTLKASEARQEMFIFLLLEMILQSSFDILSRPNLHLIMSIWFYCPEYEGNGSPSHRRGTTLTASQSCLVLL